MRPTLKDEERSALMMLGKKDPKDINPFQRHIRGEIGRLSGEIEKERSDIDRMTSDIAEARDRLAQGVGAFEAVATTYLSYLTSGGPQEAPQAPPVAPEPDHLHIPEATLPEPAETAPVAAVEPPLEAPGEEAPEPEVKPEPVPAIYKRAKKKRPPKIRNVPAPETD